MELPIELNALERRVVVALLDRAREGAQIYAGDYSAPWLLSPTIYCDVWSLRKADGETRSVEGEVIGNRSFDWRIRLPNGSVLTDRSNAQLCRSMQRIGFLARTMPGGPETLLSHLNFLWSISFIARWMFLQEGGLDPSNFGFTRLKQEHFSDMVRDLALGGVPFALQCPQRFLRAIFPVAVGRDPTKQELLSPMALGQQDCEKVGAWFSAAGLIRRARRKEGPGTINRRVVAEMIGADTLSLTGNAKFSAFLSQFTQGALIGSRRAFRGSADSRREHASHRAQLLDELIEAPVSEKSVGKYLDDFRTLFFVQRHLPGDCPDPREYRPKRLAKLAAEVCRPRETTPWVPLKTALTYTRESLRWVHVYGDELVDTFLKAYSQLYQQGLLAPPPTGTSAEKATENKARTARRECLVELVQLPKALEPLNIQGWSSYVHLDGMAGFEKLREAPSLLDAIMILIGAISILTATMKPMRESELRRLRRSCVILRKGDGYWLSAGQGKRAVANVNPRLQRPIPAILARGLTLLRRLTDGVKEIVGVEDPWLLESLFALPVLSLYEARIDGIVSAQQLNQLLDTFCDYVGLPPDSSGRRWYIRIHELRKSFLIVFFWTYRYANLDAAAWMAGHSSVAQLYAYLQVNFPGEELPALEAEYASQVLRSNGDSLLSVELENVESLRDAVCGHFGVSDVSWIEERALQEWLTLRFSSGDFEITPYSLPGVGHPSDVHIAFRVRAPQ